MKIAEELSHLANKSQAKILQRFFKTGQGEYGEGDIFLGITVPQTRIIAKKYLDISLTNLRKNLYSKIHEERLCALLVLVEKYVKADEKEKTQIFDFYFKNIKQVNNWDLVDLSAPKIVGEYLIDKSRDILYKLAKSKKLWERRIAIISTYAFIKRGDFKDTLKVSEILLKAKEDLIQKAVGWMLREVGKKEIKVEEIFLKKYCQLMPRTMLRYAIEKFPEGKRKSYLKIK
jgi:3-methyladenine DNA glycosylase AlkD